MIWGCRGLQALHDSYLSCVFHYLDSLKYIQNTDSAEFFEGIRLALSFFLSP